MCTHISLMHDCLGSSRGNRGHAGEKKDASGSIAHALHEMVHGFMHDYPMHDISNHKPRSEKLSSHPRMPRLPGTLEVRQLKPEPSLNPSHPCSVQLVAEKIQNSTRPSRIPFRTLHSRVSPDRIKLPAWNIPIGRAFLE